MRLMNLSGRSPSSHASLPKAHEPTTGSRCAPRSRTDSTFWGPISYPDSACLEISIDTQEGAIGGMTREDP